MRILKIISTSQPYIEDKTQRKRKQAFGIQHLSFLPTLGLLGILPSSTDVGECCTIHCFLVPVSIQNHHSTTFYTPHASSFVPAIFKKGDGSSQETT